MTDRHVELHSEAFEEAERALFWYRERSPRAAESFLIEFQRVLDRIAETPHLWPKAAGGWRRYPFLGFPFFVVYQELRNSIFVVAVAHGRRKPGYWRSRIVPQG